MIQWFRRRRQRRLRMEQLEEERFRLVVQGQMITSVYFSFCSSCPDVATELVEEIDKIQNRISEIAGEQDELQRQGVCRNWDSVITSLSLLQ